MQCAQYGHRRSSDARGEAPAARRLRTQATRYCFVGLVNVMIDVGVLNLLVRLTGLTRGAGFVALGSSSYCLALLNSYIWNGRWTFGNSTNTPRQIGLFIVANGIGLAINDAALYLLTAVPHPWIGRSPLLHVDEAKAIAVGLTAVWTFIAFRLWVFAPPRTAGPRDVRGPTGPALG